jgi:ketosteroid isomerase-like protein
MSANLDLVRSIYADWERGDFSRVDWVDPAIEFVLPDWPEAGTWSGLVGMATAWRGVSSAWEDYRLVADEYHELDGERVLVINHARGRGRTSGLEVGQITTHLTEPGANLFHVHGGKVTRLVSYWNRSRAFADLGLAAENDAP